MNIRSKDGLLFEQESGPKDMKTQVYHHTNTNSNQTAGFHCAEPDSNNFLDAHFQEPSPMRSGQDNYSRNKTKLDKDQIYGMEKQLTFNGRLDCICGLGRGCTQC